MDWRSAQKNVEISLHKFLGLDEDTSVIYVNRGASALHMALDYISSKTEIGSAWIESPSFHAAERIVKRIFPSINTEDAANPDITVPRTLGGEAIEPGWFDEDSFLVYDCAQSCYQDMFGNISFHRDQFAILSFQESKPLGSRTGGGALICNRSIEETLRKEYVPGKWYYNPRTGQCKETDGRIFSYDSNDIRRAHESLKELLLERAKLEHVGYELINFSIDLERSVLYTHAYVETPERINEIKDLLERGYRYYADDKLMRKELKLSY